MNHRNIACSKCGIEFHCLRDESQCWCHAWHIPKDVATKLQSLYYDCICPDCMKIELKIPNERSKDNNQG